MSWKTLGIWIISLAGLSLVCWLALRSVSNSYMIGYVPDKFGLTQTYSEGACVNNVFAYVGAFAVGLGAPTIREIEEKGISYFDDVGGPRERSRGIQFRDWKETPVPQSALSGEPSSNLYCGSSKGWFWPGGLEQALLVPGSFYSDDLGPRSAVVIPSLGIIAISMQTR